MDNGNSYNIKNNELIERYHQGDTAAMEELILLNDGLIHSIVKKYCINKEMMEDCLQEGRMATLMAVDNFDMSFGASFATYAAYWIRKAVWQYIQQNSTLISYPDEEFSLYFQIQKIEQEAMEHGFPVPTNEDIAKMLDVSIVKVMEIRSVYLKESSMQNVVSNENELDLEDILESGERADTVGIQNDTREKLLDVIEHTLKGTDKQVLIMRYGLDDGIEKTVEEIAETLNIPKEKVRSFEARAIRKLKNPRVLVLLQELR